MGTRPWNLRTELMLYIIGTETMMENMSRPTTSYFTTNTGGFTRVQMIVPRRLSFHWVIGNVGKSHGAGQVTLGEED